MHKAAVILC